MNDKITITVYGRTEPEHSHKTVVQNQKGQKEEYYFDGWEGTSYRTITELLDLVGIEYFTVIKN